MRKSLNQTSRAFVVRPSLILKLALLVPALFAVALSFYSRSGAVVVACLVTLGGISLWWLFFARISIAVDADEVSLVGPFYRRQVRASEIVEMSIEEDAGLSAGLMNWPVTGRAKGLNGVRLNMGGKSALTIRTQDSETYCFVFPDNAGAELCRDYIEKSGS